MDGDVSGNLTYDPLGGLQLVRGVLIDAHFHERGRQVRLRGGGDQPQVTVVQGRLARLAADLGTGLAVGLDEDTALVCPALAPSCGVLGAGGVWTLGLSPASCGAAPWRCGGLVTSYLTAGDSLQLADWSVHFAGDKEDVLGTGGLAPDQSEDIFGLRLGASEYQRVAASLLLSPAASTARGRTRQTEPLQYSAVFSRDQGTRARASQGGIVSYSDLYLDLESTD